MDPLLQPLLALLDRLSNEFYEVREGVNKAIDISSRDPEMALTRARKVMELVIRELYQRRVNEPPGTRPLENLIQRLVKDGFFPDRLDAYATTVRKLGNVGTHSFGEPITVADVSRSLSHLQPILEWYFLKERPDAVSPGGTEPLNPEGTSGPSPLAPHESMVAIVPKGLRSFDAKDADFFLDLLPGPRDRTGLPESIRFWKHRIEEKDEPTFTVGVIYGPSGCGKSSLVKAGLLPRLAAHVLPVYVEATANDTEDQLLQGLRRRCPGVAADLDLTETIVALRQGSGRKLLIVLDQFEQWLHAHRGQQDTELATAVRQCDGDHVQCIVMVRDDFWMALTRFMNDLHIEVHQGQNMALVDLFDPIHARDVLSAFGRAFGRLSNEPSREQAVFLDQAVAGLSQDGRVICVRLALFAEMVKGRPWTPTTLKEVGGTEGVGVAFLEETFGAAASPRNRLHQQAARSVLKALLPEQGSDIKGNLQSHDKLLEVSGYGRRPKEFEDVLRLLDGELRLITPTESPEQDCKDEQPAPAEKYYQLTHDYLVPSLREWLTRKQKETRRGRAELLLADRAVVWKARPENRQLPSLWQWCSIRWLTAKKNWTPPQKKMMAKAGRFHGVRGMAIAVLVAVATLAGLFISDHFVEKNKATHAAGLVKRLLDAETAQVPDIIAEMEGYRQWTDPLLRQENEEAGDSSRQKLHTSLALLPVDEGQVDYLFQRLLDAGPTQLPVIRKALRGHQGVLAKRLWGVLEDERQDADRRFRAACALAGYDTAGDGRWRKASPLVVARFLAQVQKNPSHYTPLLEMLRPVRGELLDPLSKVYRGKERSDSERSWATSILADYAADRPEVLAGLLTDGDEKQFAVLFPKVVLHRERVVPLLNQTVKTPLESKKKDEEKEELAKRQANAAVALLRLGQPEWVWPLLRHRSDPRARSYLIHRLAPLDANPVALLGRREEEKEVSIRRALLLALGEFGPDRLPLAEGKRLLGTVWQMYQEEADAGLHGAAEWLLRQWKQQGKLKESEQRLAREPAIIHSAIWAWASPRFTVADWSLAMWVAKATPTAGDKARLGQIRKELAKGKERRESYWYVNGQGQTMVVVPGPVEFMMGSPPKEEGRYDYETQHKKRISRSFAIAAQSVTWEQYLKFAPEEKNEREDRYSPTIDCPANYISWYMAAAYCNWLSKEEGIDPNQWCYEIKGKETRLRENYLSLTGYRLPTEAEMEYATRAGALTSRYYGETADLLPKYAWYFTNSKEKTWPVGSLKPNDLGLFDVQGNVYTWCQESYRYYPTGKSKEAAEDREDGLVVESTRSRVLRGGSFNYQASNVRSADRLNGGPALRSYSYGLRPARTFR